MKRRVFIGASLAATACSLDQALAFGRREIFVFSFANDYQSDQDLALTSPTQDARTFVAVARELPHAHCQDALINPSREGFISALEAFLDRIARADRPIVLFHYAGHGVQIGDGNYFLLNDSVTLFCFNGLLARLSVQGQRSLVAFLDCCRNNPLEVGSAARYKVQADLDTDPVDLVVSNEIRAARGLRQFDDTGLSAAMIGFSTQPGWTAADGAGLSPYTAALQRRLPEQVSAPVMFARVAADVQHGSSDDARQIPFVQGDLQDLYLAGYPRTHGAVFIP